MHYFPFLFQFSFRNNFEAAALMQIKVKTFAQPQNYQVPSVPSPYFNSLADFCRASINDFLLKPKGFMFTCILRTSMLHIVICTIYFTLESFALLSKFKPPLWLSLPQISAYVSLKLPSEICLLNCEVSAIFWKATFSSTLPCTNELVFKVCRFPLL